MPPVSKRQARFLRAVANGDAHAPGLSRREAREYVQHYPTRTLPESSSSTKKRGRK